MPRHATRNSDESRAGTPHAPAPQQIVPSLLAWFAVHARDLPWRRTRDPYAIWVSEIMLQQTQVKTVIPYWDRWMRELPTIESLAVAKPGEIHKLWEGLGYYTRVRNMQKAAQQIVRLEKQKAESRKQKGEGRQHRTLNVEHRTLNESDSAPHNSCQFPTDFDDILGLPGIGRYTAGAIASIAFNQPAPILDGNVIRVLTRLHGIAADPREKKTNARLWQLAEELVCAAAGDTQHAAPINREQARNTHEGIKSKITIKIKNPAAPPCSALNQSLMELGALICTPRSPSCSACPVAGNCIALRENRVEKIPRPKQRAAVTARRFLAFVIGRDGRLLVRQRADGVVNAHLWEFPNVEAKARDAVAVVVEKHFGVKPRLVEKLCVVKHSITRYRITTEAHCVSFDEPCAGVPGVWRTPAQLHKLPFTAAHRRIAMRLGKP